MKQNSLGTKVLMIAVTLALVAYFGFQGVRYLTDPLTTTLAYNYRVEETLNLSGYVVRDEVVLPEESSGLLQIQREEGERVSTGGTAAAGRRDSGCRNPAFPAELCGRIRHHAPVRQRLPAGGCM